MRIDLQQTFPGGNQQRFVNIQVQLNRQRGSGTNFYTTIATAIVQSDSQGNVLMPIRYVRDALLRSLRDCATVESCTNYGRNCRLEARRL